MTLFKEDLHNVVAQIFARVDNTYCQIVKEMAVDTVFYKVQDQYHGGNGINFNLKANNRFSLISKSKGVMYLATTPHTGLKEYYQEYEFIDIEEDLELNCMAEIQAARTIKIIDLAVLAPLLKVALGDLMGPKAVYEDTQLLAEVLSNYADGMEYLSRHTGKPCIALWSDAVDGNGMLENLSVKPLSEYSYNGMSAELILKYQLNYKIT
ncbi:RES family NAD+ phosphorylase (plasmid) [Citrobacter freundii]|uniref:RES family NAD+ phosphorylase n=1 Tax=Citrobacter freundii TaxID=546 RepID=UPI0015E598DE|nr:RES family NAD+ phosphorylase [Citrobacter werkmanii]MBA8330602.1 RES family NAD+ phosphorylase [Citrobacter freundii]HEM7419259.1 RES family NAD+ phosphorylase [Citrobacter youngae]MBA8335220.1 RES family NAD+ phosphorylase [Citrobacter freundii]MBA8564048.1 RES family NAD+ phosphorylase [Citrobacter freundii]